jgi:hypothetical protein
MSQTLEIIEFAIVIAAPNYDPTLLNPSFLAGSGIIPGDWEIARQPIVSQRVSQVVYNNGINLVAQPNRLILVEALEDKTEQAVSIPSIACRYIESMPNLQYQAAGINFRGYVPFSGEASKARNYLFGNVLASGSWQEMGTSPVQANLNFLYTFDAKRLALNINEAALQLPEQEKLPVILFNGNFEYELKAEDTSDRRSELHKIINNWHEDKAIKTKVVNQFLEAQNRGKQDKISAKAALAS